MERTALPQGYWIDGASIKVEDEGILTVAHFVRGPLSKFNKARRDAFAAAMNAPRPAEAALAAEVERLREAIIEARTLINSSIAADDGHSADELGQADNILNMALAQQKQEG